MAKLKVRPETAMIMKALNQVLNREDAMNRKVTYEYPKGHPKEGETVKAPVWSFAKGLLKTFPKKKIAKRIDGFMRKYDFIAAPFFEELAEVLVENGYYQPQKRSVTHSDEEQLRERIEKEKQESDLKDE